MTKASAIMISASIYLASTGILVLQLLFFNDLKFGRLGYFGLHMAVYWLVIAGFILKPLWQPWTTTMLAALIMGSAPFEKIADLFSFLNGRIDYEFSSLTQGLPLILRLLYEVMVFPLIQMLLFGLIGMAWRSQVRAAAVSA